jgi:hypothetical protein
MDAALWGLLGTLVGAGVSIGTSLIGVWKERRLQEKQYSFEREERARTFQRENLLKIQDLLQKSIRLMGQAHFSDMNVFSETGDWGNSLLDDELDEAISINNRELVITIERISNDDLRALIKDFRNHVSLGLLAKSMKESENKLHEASDLFMKLMERVGVELRKNY